MVGFIKVAHPESLVLTLSLLIVVGWFKFSKNINLIEPTVIFNHDRTLY